MIQFLMVLPVSSRSMRNSSTSTEYSRWFDHSNLMSVLKFKRGLVNTINYWNCLGMMKEKMKFVSQSIPSDQLFKPSSQFLLEMFRWIWILVPSKCLKDLTSYMKNMSPMSSTTSEPSSLDKNITPIDRLLHLLLKIILWTRSIHQPLLVLKVNLLLSIVVEFFQGLLINLSLSLNRLRRKKKNKSTFSMLTLWITQLLLAPNLLPLLNQLSTNLNKLISWEASHLSLPPLSLLLNLRPLSMIPLALGKTPINHLLSPATLVLEEICLGLVPLHPHPNHSLLLNRPSNLNLNPLLGWEIWWALDFLQDRLNLLLQMQVRQGSDLETSPNPSLSLSPRPNLKTTTWHLTY